MTAIPVPRQPRCWRHVVWMASCPDCTRERQAQRERQGTR